MPSNNDALVTMLNKVFHDERLDCTNLMMFLNLKITNLDLTNEKENAKAGILMVLMEVLETRIKTDAIANKFFYIARNLFEEGKL